MNAFLAGFSSLNLAKYWWHDILLENHWLIFCHKGGSYNRYGCRQGKRKDKAPEERRDWLSHMACWRGYMCGLYLRVLWFLLWPWPASDESLHMAMNKCLTERVSVVLLYLCSHRTRPSASMHTKQVENKLVVHNDSLTRYVAFSTCDNIKVVRNLHHELSFYCISWRQHCKST